LQEHLAATDNEVIRSPYSTALRLPQPRLWGSRSRVVFDRHLPMESFSLRSPLSGGCVPVYSSRSSRQPADGLIILKPERLGNPIPAVLGSIHAGQSGSLIKLPVNPADPVWAV